MRAHHAILGWLIPLLALGSLAASEAVEPKLGEPTPGNPAWSEQRKRGKGPVLKLARGHRRMHRLGKVMEGGQESHVFRLVTAGPGDVVIDSVVSNCVCGVGRVNRIEGGERVPYEVGTPLPPGTELEVEALLDTFASLGENSATLSIRANAVTSTLILNMRADVRPGILVEPAELDVAELVGNPTLVRIRDNGIGAFHLRVRATYLDRKPQPEGGPITVELSPVDPDSEGRAHEWEARVSLNADRLLGAQRFNVELESDVVTRFQPPPKEDPEDTEPAALDADGEAEEPAVRKYLTWIHVNGKIERGVSIHPPLVSFGKIEGSEGVERRVTLQSRDEHPLPASPKVELERLRPEGLSADSFAWEIASRKEGGLELVIRLIGLPEDFRGSFEGVLTVRLNHPKLSVARVRFTGARP